MSFMQNCDKGILQPAFGMRSTQTLVEIYNIQSNMRDEPNIPVLT